MQRFKVVTLVDITETKQYRKEPGKELAQQQQQNFITLLQTLGFRVNAMYDRSPDVKDVDLKELAFGSNYQGVQKVWEFDFYIEFDGGLADQGNQAGFLFDDLHYVPVIRDLNETVEFYLPVFDTKNLETKNTLIYYIEG